MSTAVEWKANVASLRRDRRRIRGDDQQGIRALLRRLTELPTDSEAAGHVRAGCCRSSLRVIVGEEGKLSAAQRMLLRQKARQRDETNKLRSLR
jgi:hypothetical protein